MEAFSDAFRKFGGQVKVLTQSIGTRTEQKKALLCNERIAHRSCLPSHNLASKLLARFGQDVLWCERGGACGQNGSRHVTNAQAVKANRRFVWDRKVNCECLGVFQSVEKFNRVRFPPAHTRAR